MPRALFAVLATLSLAGCGRDVLEVRSEPDIDSPNDSDTLESARSDVIVGSVNWKSVTLLDTSSPAYRNSLAVGYLSIPAKGVRCTAWLISEGKLVTNNHCVPSASAAVGAKASFNYVDGVSSTSRIWYDCSGFVKTWSDIDATVLQCKPLGGLLPGQVHGWLELAENDAANSGADMYLIHQNCDYETQACTPTKKYSPGLVKDPTVGDYRLSYSADTLGGSSGSPVFSAKGHRVIGLHHTGVGGDSNGRGTSNQGTRVSVLRSRLSQLGLPYETLTVDSHPYWNDPDVAVAEISENWTSAEGASGSYLREYRWAVAEDIGDPAVLWFYLPSAGTRTLEMWWTSGSDRSAGVPVFVNDASGARLSLLYVNQQQDGSRWNSLGEFAFTQGWNKVQISRRATSPGYVLADAIRIR